jgi:hypothetical protein
MIDIKSDSKMYWITPSMSHMCRGLMSHAHTSHNNSCLAIIVMESD